MATWDRPGQGGLGERLASQPTQSRLLDILAHVGNNLEVLRASLGQGIERFLRLRSDHRVRWGTIDIDSFPMEVYGDQAGAAYHGHDHAKILHPMVASWSVAGDYDSQRPGGRLGNGFIHAILRRGNAPAGEGILRFLDRVLEVASRLAYVYDLRLDAGLTEGRVLDDLTRRKVRFLGRLKSNRVLEALAEPHLRRPPGRPPQGGYETVVGFWERLRERMGSWRLAGFSAAAWPDGACLAAASPPCAPRGGTSRLSSCTTRQRHSGYQVSWGGGGFPLARPSRSSS